MEAAVLSQIFAQYSSEFALYVNVKKSKAVREIQVFLSMFRSSLAGRSFIPEGLYSKNS